MDEIYQALGRIEGKLDSALRAAEEHREDDTRRFTEVYKRLETHSAAINEAKGAKGVITALASVISAAVGAVTVLLAKLFGLHQ